MSWAWAGSLWLRTRRGSRHRCSLATGPPHPATAVCVPCREGRSSCSVLTLPAVSFLRRKREERRASKLRVAVQSGQSPERGLKPQLWPHRPQRALPPGCQPLGSTGLCGATLGATQPTFVPCWPRAPRPPVLQLGPGSPAWPGLFSVVMGGPALGP